VNRDTGQAWWRACSKQAYSDGVAAAVDAYWNWQQSRAGARAGRRVGFLRVKKTGRDGDRVSFTTGAVRVEADRRHVRLPVIGTVGTHENTRGLERRIRAGRARILAISVGRNGDRIDASVHVLVKRPIQARVALPQSRVGVDVGVRVLATVATANGAVIERVENPRPLPGRAARPAPPVPRPVPLPHRFSAVPPNAPSRFPAAPPGRSCPRPSPARPDDATGQHSPPHRDRVFGRCRDAATEATDRSPRPTPRTVRLSPRSHPPPAVLQDRPGTAPP
jgi:hypothetical protein